MQVYATNNVAKAKISSNIKDELSRSVIIFKHEYSYQEKIGFDFGSYVKHSGTNNSSTHQLS